MYQDVQICANKLEEDFRWVTRLNETNYSRMDQVKVVEDSL